MKKEMTSMKQTRLHSILDEATKLLIEKPNASMNDIADSARIGIATLHRYVESREQLMVHLGLRAIEVVSEAMQNIHLDEENCESYIPELIEVLIPLGDKIYFLTHDATVLYNPEIEGADLKLREPILQAVGLLQQKGYFRQNVDKNWIVDVLYSILFLTWQQVISGHIARKSAASLVVDTFYHGFRAK
ncbi:TetR/AcrR family transcriptional regulator [Paenibacillus sp. JNUCC31]|uniref:TetR/AcrR family transcriptional regulator n=1 Tax=Paenibacillus sp. JNUCC-31 TaxID=2777983 RepID=UPI001786CAB3|nr:helix-turn-helix domain-containing protein [Paenibacillus sp. JNUCC-31]QOS78829.1 TetR/AcrR family transcriptional regulator [Paenibacillus sp. JNUCC-31]